MTQKKRQITDNDVKEIINEVTKNCKQYFDEEINLRVNEEVKKEVQRLFRELGRM